MLKRQRGLSTSGLILAIGIAGFFLTLFFKMGPAYLDNMGVRSAMKSMLKNNPNIADLPKDKIYKELDNYFTINGVRNVNARKDFEVVRRKDRMLINNAYEVRIPIFGNVDVVMIFQNQIDSSNPEECCSYLIDEEGKPVKEK